MKKGTFTNTVQYVDIRKHWKKIKPHIESPAARAIWLPDLLQYRALRQLDCFDTHDMGYLGWSHMDYTQAEYPKDFDSCDWRCDTRQCAYMKWVCWNACHWVVNLNLWLAELVFPDTKWRIVNSDEHGTVWNGNVEDVLLFDMNYLALNVTPLEAWASAATKPYSQVYAIGERYQPTDHITVVNKLIELGCPLEGRGRQALDPALKKKLLDVLARYMAKLRHPIEQTAPFFAVLNPRLLKFLKPKKEQKPIDPVEYPKLTAEQEAELEEVLASLPGNL